MKKTAAGEVAEAIMTGLVVLAIILMPVWIGLAARLGGL